MLTPLTRPAQCFLAHAGTVMPDGSLVAAPSSMSALFSHLSSSLKALGRTGPWDPEKRSGNPVDSEAVRLYKRGYGRMLRAQGYEEGSAIIWEEADVFTTIDQLDKEAGAFLSEATELTAAGRPQAALRPLVRGLLLDRDALACTYQWEGLQRGKEGGQLTCSDFVGEDGKEVLSRLSILLASAPGQVKVRRLPQLPLAARIAQLRCWHSMAVGSGCYSCGRLVMFAPAPAPASAAVTALGDSCPACWPERSDATYCCRCWCTPMASSSSHL